MSARSRLSTSPASNRPTIRSRTSTSRGPMSSRRALSQTRRSMPRQLKTSVHAADSGGIRVTTPELIRRDAATLAAQIAAKEVSSTDDAGIPRSTAATDELWVPHPCTWPATPRRRGGQIDAAAAAGEDLLSPLAGAAGAQGRVHHHRHVDHVRLEDPRRVAFAVRRDRHGAGWQPPILILGNQHGRVRDGQPDRELRLRADSGNP